MRVVAARDLHHVGIAVADLDAAVARWCSLLGAEVEAEEEEALAAFGNAAFTLYEAGTLSMSSDLAAAAERIRTARTAIEEKKAEANAAGADADGADAAEGANGADSTAG